MNKINLKNTVAVFLYNINCVFALDFLSTGKATDQFSFKR